MSDTVTRFGNADKIDALTEMNPDVIKAIASIFIFSSQIEYYLEKCIWQIEEKDVRGSRPVTDCKPISELINIFKTRIQALPNHQFREFLLTWCESAMSGFEFRNNIAHGLPIKVEETLIFIHNPQWHGEIRKRESRELHADPWTLNVIRECFAGLLRIIAAVHRNYDKISTTVPNEMSLALREIKSIFGEIHDKDYNPSIERY